MNMDIKIQKKLQIVEMIQIIQRIQKIFQMMKLKTIGKVIYYSTTLLYLYLYSYKYLHTSIPQYHHRCGDATYSRVVGYGI